MTKALSVRQPWAWAMFWAGKNVENRTWTTEYRGPLLIHASKTRDPTAELALEEMGVPVPPDLPRGGAVGVVDLVDVIKDSDSRWAEPGQFHWILDYPRLLPFEPARGRLRLFELTSEAFEKHPSNPRYPSLHPSDRELEMARNRRWDDDEDTYTETILTFVAPRERSPKHVSAPQRRPKPAQTPAATETDESDAAGYRPTGWRLYGNPTPTTVDDVITMYEDQVTRGRLNAETDLQLAREIKAGKVTPEDVPRELERRWLVAAAASEPAHPRYQLHHHFDYGLLREVPGSLCFEAWIEGNPGEPGMWHRILFNPFTASMSPINDPIGEDHLGNGGGQLGDMLKPVENERYERSTIDNGLRRGEPMRKDMHWDHDGPRPSGY